MPELAQRDPAFANIIIRNLLRMSSGIKYAEFPFVNGDDAKTYYYPNLRQLALEDTQIVGVPGEEFHYSNYHPLFPGTIIERATGTSVANYLQEKYGNSSAWNIPARGAWMKTDSKKMESGINARPLEF